MKTPNEGRIIISKPCCLSTNDNPCLGIIEWRKESILAFKFELRCAGVEDAEVAQSVEALEGITCKSLQHDIGLPKTTDGWWVEKGLCRRFKHDNLWYFSNALTKRFQQRYNAAKTRAYRNLNKQTSGRYWYGSGPSTHDW